MAATMVETKRDIFSEKPCAVIWNPNLVGLMEWMRPAWRAVYVNSDRWSLMVCTNKLFRLQSRGDLEKMQSIINMFSDRINYEKGSYL